MKDILILFVVSLIALVIVIALGYVVYWLWSLTGWQYKAVSVIFALITIAVAYFLYAFIEWGWEQTR